ncbi:hypothetical protein H1235_12785 [Pseudoxanthomonas sp. NC8]|nr:hypothetical protein H1235_12785 [Pseudoxanthomonas sp. NC8]
MLFGMGFAMMAQRADAAGRPFTALYWRRSLGLLGIGLTHALLLWSGDVLVTYAVLAMLLPAFREAPARMLAWVGVACYLIAPALLLGLGLLSGVTPGWDEAMATQARRWRPCSRRSDRPAVPAATRRRSRSASATLA